MFDLGSTVIPVKLGARTALLTEEYKKTCPMEMSCVLENLRKTMRIIVALLEQEARRELSRRKT